MHIFISYAKNDTKALAQQLRDELTALQQVTAWMDEGIDVGEDWSKRIRLEIDRCDWVIVLISPDVNRETFPPSFVINEIQYALMTQKSILPVLAQPTDMRIELLVYQHIDISQNPTNGVEMIVKAVCKRTGIEPPASKVQLTKLKEDNSTRIVKSEQDETSIINIKCPYCLTRQPFEGSNICPNCEQEVPTRYITNSKKQPPVWLVTVGYTQHGKSTYIDGLAVMVENLGKITSGTFHQYLDTYTFEKIKELRRQVQEGILPSSPQDLQLYQPLLITLNSFLTKNLHNLVIYDFPGGIFDDREAIADHAKVISHAKTVWFFVSLPDMVTDGSGRYISDLFEVYLESMERLGVRVDNKNALIVYTKADRLIDRLPDSVRTYLQDDPYYDLKQKHPQDFANTPFDNDAYIERLLHISDELKNFTFNEVDGGIPSIHMIENSGMNLAFTITAVTGVDVDQMGVSICRYRVLDPLIWALTL